MKNKYRDITVDGVKYAWNVIGGWCWDTDVYTDEYITIWLNKKIIYQEKHLGDVKPKDIANIIKEKDFSALNVKWSNNTNQNLK